MRPAGSYIEAASRRTPRPVGDNAPSANGISLPGGAALDPVEAAAAYRQVLRLANRHDCPARALLYGLLGAALGPGHLARAATPIAAVAAVRPSLLCTNDRHTADVHDADLLLQAAGIIPTIRPTTGTCQGCGRPKSIRADGRICKHHIAGAPCPGGSRLPAREEL